MHELKLVRSRSICFWTFGSTLLGESNNVRVESSNPNHHLVVRISHWTGGLPEREEEEEEEDCQNILTVNLFITISN